MITNIPSEILELEAGVSYKPTKISTDKRRKNSTIGYYQIGEDDQQGKARGPVFRLVFVDLSLASATHVRLFGISNNDGDGVEIPITHFTAAENNTVDLYLSKFDFTDGNGNAVEEDAANYQVVGYKHKQLPLGVL